MPVAKVAHSFGRSETVDREALARLVRSISRFLTPEQSVAVQQIAEYAGGPQRILKHVGSAHNDAELGVFLERARAEGCRADYRIIRILKHPATPRPHHHNPPSRLSPAD